MRDFRILERWALLLHPAIRTHPRRLEWPDVWRSPDGWVVEIFGLWQLGIRRSDDGA